MSSHKRWQLLVLLMLCALCCLGTTVKAEEPLRILFIGNSFTNQGPIPDLVRELAIDDLKPEPYVKNTSVSGKTLEFHSTYIPTLKAIDEGGWDYVVLQEYSTRPTDNIGDPAAFKFYATFLYDKVKESSPAAQIILYETWARHEDHNFYPDNFADRDQMQEQLVFHYHDCADNYIPANSTTPDPNKADVTVAPAGEAWHANYKRDNIMLHGDDLYHGGTNGQYLSAMAIYSTIYQSPVSGLTPLLDVTDANAIYLQDICDAVTSGTIPICGDGACDLGEDECNCPEDCGIPSDTETICNDGRDGDCDGYIDCDDIDCEEYPACMDCLPKGEACTDDIECCSGKCAQSGKCT